MCYSQFDFHFNQPPENNKTRNKIMGKLNHKSINDSNPSDYLYCTKIAVEVAREKTGLDIDDNKIQNAVYSGAIEGHTIGRKMWISINSLNRWVEKIIENKKRENSEEANRYISIIKNLPKEEQDAIIEGLKNIQKGCR